MCKDRAVEINIKLLFKPRKWATHILKLLSKHLYNHCEIYLWETVQRWVEGDDEKLIDIRKGNETSLHKVNQASCTLLIFQSLRHCLCGVVWIWTVLGIIENKFS